MPQGHPQLDYIINAENFRRIQDSLAESTELAMLTVDFHGDPVTAHSRCSAYCARVRADAALGDRCRLCDSRGGLEATRQRRPYVYLCHMDLIDFAVPIVVDGRYLGAIMAGQARLAPGSRPLERVAAPAEDPAALELAFRLAPLREALPVMSLDRVDVIARMMFHICTYIVEEALVKLHLMENYRSPAPPPPPAAGGAPGASAVPPGPAVFGGSPLIKPALDYIAEHCGERLSLELMAARCNISPSYFSKLFNRATGDNFAGFVNRVRVARARELLLSTDQGITAMAMDLGFEDSGYFDKVFKKALGVTPKEYRLRGGILV